MPVPLDDPLQEIAPERRTEIERNAAALADDHRRCSEAMSSSSSKDAVLGAQAATGQRCPRSGGGKSRTGLPPRSPSRSGM